MSQVNENDLQQGVETPVDDEETQFDQGFSIGEDEAEAKGSAEKGQEQEANSEGNEAAGSQEPAKADEGKQTNVQNEQPPAAEQPQQPQPQMEQPRESAPAEPEPPKKIEVPENLTEEFAALKKLNPAAAELALEDSPEGERLRSRMEEYGAEMALDRAEVVLDKRNRDVATRKADFERQQQAVQEHNNRFLSTLKQTHPDYAAMITDPARRDEAVKKQNEIIEWINGKPYAEGARLMQVAKSGRDPNEICALLTQFESERQAKPKPADPTGALAVPGRGAPAAPAGIGDKDDFDAGWNLEK